MTATDARSSAPPHSPLRAWLELLRLPNLATAWSDILMGFLVTHSGFAPWPILLLLLAASSGCYLAGMVLNDVFDLETDRVERPGRPLPSGRVSRAAALRGGILLLAGGVTAAWIVAVMVGEWRPGIVATLLAGAVWLYDGPAKRLAIAPLIMGSCRSLNVLLGMSAAAAPWQPYQGVIAAGLGLYIAGVTWYARTEARPSNRLRLAFGLGMILLGLGLLAWFPDWVVADGAAANLQLQTTPDRWRLLMALLGALIGWRLLWGILEPIPAHVQLGVKQAILSVIVLDASITFVFRGFDGALPVLVLLIPAMWLGKWIYST
ncbi:MAG: UbiA family prenyltransferase [Planctomycetaceae bacterium]|nr:UbiA family prenyltransferase [Planctomycetaceae bacterium]